MLVVKRKQEKKSKKDKKEKKAGEKAVCKKQKTDA
jgi:hypothetical protein